MEATPWVILSWGSVLLRGISRTLRPQHFDAGTSHGVLLPYSAQGEGNPRLAGFPVKLPGFHQESASWSPKLATVPLSGFPNLSAALFFPSPACRFQAVGTLGVIPFRGSCLSRSPNASSTLACLHGVYPARLRSSLPRRGLLRACSPSPRIADEHLSVAFEAFILVRIGQHHYNAVGTTVTDLPLVGFCLLMVCTLVRVRDFRHEDHHALRVTTPSLD